MVGGRVGGNDKEKIPSRGGADVVFDGYYLPACSTPRLSSDPLPTLAALHASCLLFLILTVCQK